MTSQSPVVTKSVHILATVTDVWKAITDPGILPQWMSESPINVICDGCVGGVFSITGKMNKAPYSSKGKIQVWNPGEQFQYSYWNKLSRLPDQPENYSILNFSLTPTETGTTLIFTQYQFKGEATYEHANFYWGVALVILKRFLETGTRAYG